MPSIQSSWEPLLPYDLEITMTLRFNINALDQEAVSLAQPAADQLHQQNLNAPINEDDDAMSAEIDT